jgi:hypothetical protein
MKIQILLAISLAISSPCHGETNSALPGTLPHKEDAARQTEIKNPDGTRTILHLENKKIKHSEVYAADGQLKFTEDFSYLPDSKRVDRVKRYKPDKTLWLETKFYWNSKGEQVGVKSFDPTGREIPPKEWGQYK